MTTNSRGAPTNSRGAPRVLLKVSDNREYAFLLKQPAIVYNRLLEDKFDKLLDAILKKKLTYDQKCNELAEEDEDQVRGDREEEWGKVERQGREFGLRE